MDAKLYDVGSSQSQLLGVAYVVLGGSVLLYLAYRWALPRPLPGIPYDEEASKSLLGNLPQIFGHVKEKGTIFPWFTEQNLKHNSSLFQFWQSPLGKPSILLTDFQEIQDILLRRTKEFDRSQLMINVFRGGVPDHHIAMRSSDPRFKGNKEIVRDLMSPSFLHATSANEIYLKTMSLVRLWSFKAKAAEGRPFHAEPDIFGAAMDIINAAGFAFNDSLSGIRHQLDYLNSKDSPPPVVKPDGSIEFPELPPLEDLNAFITVSKAGGRAATSPFPMAVYYYIMLTDANVRRAVAHKDRVLKREIQKSIDRMQQQGDDGGEGGMLLSAVDNMLRREMAIAAKKGTQPDFFSRRILDELFGYVLAGHETTMTALLWSLKYLADHQDVQRKMREALRKAYPEAVAESRQPSVTEITKEAAPYLDAVMEECLRLGNPVRILHREAMVDTTLLGHRIPKGTVVFLINDGPGIKKPATPVDDSLRTKSSKAYYQTGAWDPADLHLFNPDRWLKKDEKHSDVFDPHAGPVLAFSLGPRGCFGRKLAYLEMRIVMVLLFWNFHFHELEGEMAGYGVVEGITTRPKHCYVSLEEL